jgi:Uri superfamily endonuclease
VDGVWARIAVADPALITYQLHIVVTRDGLLNVGRLGEFHFPAGRYVYTGSARRNLTARVRRHLLSNEKASNEKSARKALHWHIDYLLASAHAQVVEVVLSADTECVCNRRVEGSIVVAGFGASDCRAGCGSHLKYTHKK